MSHESMLAALRLNEGLGPLPDTDWTPSATLCHSPEQMRAYAMAEVRLAVAAERERCALVCESEARLWEADGTGPATEARLCAARIRSRA